MSQHKALMYPHTELEAELQQGQRLIDFDWAVANSFEQLSREVTTGKIDFVLLLETPQLPGLELLQRVRKMRPAIPAILLVPPASGAWTQTLNDPRTELVASPPQPLELQHRIAKLMSHVERAANAVPANKSLTVAVPELRNTESGKLDANLIAGAFGITLADVARSIDKKLQTVHRTPDADGLQKLLYPFERIASAIKQTTGSLQPALKIWLNAPNPTMPNSLPVNLIKAGHVEQLADLWDDTLLGHPD